MWQSVVWLAQLVWQSVVWLALQLVWQSVVWLARQQVCQFVVWQGQSLQVHHSVELLLGSTISEEHPVR